MKRIGDLEFDTLIPWIIAILVLGLTLFLYAKFNTKGGSAIGMFKQFWRFGK